MRSNLKREAFRRGADIAAAIDQSSYEHQLRRAVLSCMLFEDQFYEDGKSIADRIKDLVAVLPLEASAAIAIEARDVHRLRHVPLLIVREMARRGGSIVGRTLTHVIQRADELSEFLAIYWADGRRPLSSQVKIGLANAFRKFNAYQLAKYRGDDKAVKLRDVLFLTHAKPEDSKQEVTWKQLVERRLETPDTWEANLSGGADKRYTFERLLREKKLGYLALLRNLRNMDAAGVDGRLVEDAIMARSGAEYVLPFRYVAAARAAPRWANAINSALMIAVADLPAFRGTTAVLVDVSPSMNVAVSSRSDLTRMDAAAAVAGLCRGEQLRVFSFSNDFVEVPAFGGLAGIDAIIRSQPHNGTRLHEAISRAIGMGFERIIVMTDEQATDTPVDIAARAGQRCYMVNMAAAQNGVERARGWVRINGFSEGVLRYIHAVEGNEAR